ncbi:SHOCT domain-containing protein [Dactylosporangium sp. NPDC049525]|uniref:SHOCT domain-containing protein n=1 Tax=Dactylosporangium sp. NPDC049525 TaxID=3154730 RepID=UPI00341AA015
MRLTMRAASSLALGFTGIFLLGAGLNHLLDLSSCATGGANVIAGPCPDDTVSWILLLPVGLVIWMAALFLSEGGLVKPGAGQVLWTAGFAGGGIALLVKALTTSMDPGAKLAVYIMAAVFIPLGLAFGAVGILQLVARHGDPRDPRSRPRRQASVPVHVGEADLRRLQRLRTIGALTRAEFDALKSSPATSGDRLALLQQLAELKAAGILTTDEFEAKKQAALHGS